MPYKHIIQVVISKNPREFIVSSDQQFTRTGKNDVWCKAASAVVKDKWVTGLRRVLPISVFV